MRIIFGVLVLVSANLKGVGTIVQIVNNKSDPTVSACYGSDRSCDFYSLTCNSSAQILLGTLQYGSKINNVCRDNDQLPNKDGHCNYTEICCALNESDCVMDFIMEDTFKAHQNCSGKQMCTSIQSPWKLLNCSGNPISSYVQLQYYCIEDTSIIELNDTISVTLNSSFLQFAGIKDIWRSSTAWNCSCEIAGNGNDSTNVTVGIKDVRLSRPISVDNVTNCSSARLFIGDSFQESCNASATHDYDNFLYRKLLFFNVAWNRTLKIRLEDLFVDGKEDVPAMVWLYIEALSPINISCNPPPPPVPQTTITTTTTWTTTYTKISTTTQDPNRTSDTTFASQNTTMQSSEKTTELSATPTGTTNSTGVTNQTQLGNISKAWVYAGIGIGLGVLMLLVLAGVIIYMNRSPAHSYDLHSTTNGSVLKDNSFDENMSAARMGYQDKQDSSDF